MYGVIRRYRFDPGASEEIERQVKEGFIPLISQMQGFVTYYWLDTGGGEGVSLSVFKDKAGAEESVSLAADFVRKNMVSLLGKPEIIQGEVLAHA
jgi:hypothetical protein